jgi:GT2 family glycosyltransferase
VTRQVAVAVVVPTHRRPELLACTLEALGRLDPSPAEVVVAADRCGDGTEQLARARGATVVIPEHQGAAAARNAGWQAASAEIVAFTDDDCEPEPAWLGHLAGAFSEERIGLVQGRTLPAHPPGPNDRTIEVTSEYGLYESCNIAYRRCLLEELRGFDEGFAAAIGAPHFGEDTDLAWRARAAGWGTAFAADAVVRHAVFPSGPFAALAREWRKGRLCYLVREVPALRSNLPSGRLCLRRQSPWAQLALAGTLVAARRPVAGACLWAPYAMWLARNRPLGDLARSVARDMVGSVALLVGSVRYRSLLL